MKTRLLLLNFLLALLAGKMVAQSTIPNIPSMLTPRAIFDTLRDGYGKKYPLGTLSLRSPKPPGIESYTLANTPTVICQAGYFNLYFDANSVMFNGTNTAQATLARNVICEVFSNISGFINSPLSYTGTTNRINIFCTDVGFPFLGQANTFYMYPSSPTNTNQGVIDGMIYKAITTGIDPYTTIPITSFTTSGGNGFYHGTVLANPSYSWNLSMSTSTIGSTQYDLYSIMLHEAMHSLGFISLINPYSAYGLYTRYDQFLKDSNGNPLIVSTTSATCPNSNLVFNPALTSSVAISQSLCIPPTTVYVNLTTCSVGAKYSSSSVTSTVYTPFCWEIASSLSHFEDMCTIPAGFSTTCTPTPSTPGYNDLAFLMCNANQPGSCYIKRYMQQEERNVLCDLGYSVNGTFTSNAVGATHTYTTCSPTATIVGQNDGYNGSSYTYTTTASSMSISVASILGNDIPTSGLQISCVEVVSSIATVTITQGATNYTVSGQQGQGLVLLKYYPQSTSTSQFGNATYIYVYFAPFPCGSAPSCNMVQVNGFDMLATGNPVCGTIWPAGYNPNNGTIPVSIGCWDIYNSSVGYPYRCTNGCGGILDLGVNTFGLNPPVSNWNNVPGNSAVVMVAGPGLATALKNQLASPLIPGQVYRISLWAQNIPSSAALGFTYNPGNVPTVITIASNPVSLFTPTTNFPAGLNPLISFTIPVSNSWSQVTGTFTFSASQPTSSAIIVGINSAVSASLMGGSEMFCFIDEIELLPVASPTFAMPTGLLCGTVSYTNLAQYASTVTSETFSGGGVTFNGSQYNFSSAGINGDAPIAFTYTNGGCSNTLWDLVRTQVGTPTVSAGSGTVCVTTGGSATLTAGFANPAIGVSYSWQPGSLTGSVQVVTPTVNTIYTVTAYGTGTCSNTQTVAVIVFTNCCGTTTYQTFSSITNTVPLYFQGPLLFVTDFTVPASATGFLFIGDILFLKNTGITVPAGHLLHLDNTHLHSCGDDMWKGITVQDGGEVGVPGAYNNFIEDALIAIDVSPSFTSTTNPIDIHDVVFNKNYIDINIANYQRSSASYSAAFNIRSCVFTCRDLPYTPTSWPTTGTVSSAATSSADLRYVPSGGLTDFTGPYLTQGFSVTPLKNPYSSQSSQTAIQLSTVSVISSSVQYGIIIGDPGTSTNVNVFDSHLYGIRASDASFNSYNNTFQNPAMHNNNAGIGIYSTNSAASDNLINLTAPSSPTANINRFYDCVTGLYATGVATLHASCAEFRSSQSSTLTTPTATTAGRYGIWLSTNRVYSYLIDSSSFLNVNTGIYCGHIATGFFTLNRAVYGTVYGPFKIENNLFSPSTATNGYVSDGVILDNALTGTGSRMAH